jgi:hypothetical protein
MEVVMGIFPTCWELEAMDGRNAEDGAEDNNGDMYVRYVYGSLCMAHCASSLTFHRDDFSIRVPHSEMALGFKENDSRARVSSKVSRRVSTGAPSLLRGIAQIFGQIHGRICTLIGG